MRSIWVLLAVAIAISAPAQLSNDMRAKRSMEILTKARQVDLLSQIMPLLLTKKQIQALLPSIEKARNEVRKVELSEYQFLEKFEKTFDTAIEDSIKKDRSPDRDALADTYATFRLFQMRRAATAEENIASVMAVVEKTLNEGQKKAMAGAIRPSLIDPSVDPKKLTESMRMRYFVSAILLDPAAYPVLSRLAAR